MRALTFIAALCLSACANTLVDHDGVDLSALPGPSACDSCQAPDNGTAICVDNACSYQCTAPYLKCESGCCLASAVAAGGDTTCAIVEGGVRCWGRNDHGQLGTAGAGPFSSVPVAVAGISRPFAIAVGESHACAIDSAGVRCWGANGSGQLGQAPGADSATPVTVSVPGATSLAAGGRHTCASTGGGAVCWGANDLGQLGVLTPQQSTSPVAVSGLGAVGGLSSGLDFSCAVLAGGSVHCWGANGFGQIATGSFTLGEPQQREVLPARTGLVAVATGQRHACAIHSGTLQCWGQGTSGEMGNGSNANSAVPVKPNSISNPAAVAAGGTHACVSFPSTSNNDMLCWGANASGQLGLGNTQQFSTPQKTGLTGVRSLAAGANHTCALVATGALFCWGANDRGQAGTGGPDGLVSTPTAVSGR